MELSHFMKKKLYPGLIVVFCGLMVVPAVSTASEDDWYTNFLYARPPQLPERVPIPPERPDRLVLRRRARAGMMPEGFHGPPMPPHMVRQRAEGGPGQGPSFVELSRAPISVVETRERLRQFSERLSVVGVCANDLESVLPGMQISDILDSDAGQLYSLCSIERAFNLDGERMVYAPDQFCECVDDKVAQNRRLGTNAYRDIPAGETERRTQEMHDQIVNSSIELLYQTQRELVRDVQYAFESPEFFFSAYTRGENGTARPTALQNCLEHNLNGFSQRLIDRAGGEQGAFCSADSMRRINSLLEGEARDHAVAAGEDLAQIAQDTQEHKTVLATAIGGGVAGAIMRGAAQHSLLMARRGDLPTGCTLGGAFCESSVVAAHFQEVFAPVEGDAQETTRPSQGMFQINRRTERMIEVRRRYYDDVLVHMMNHLLVNDGEWGTGFSLNQAEINQVRIHILLNPSLVRRFEVRNPEFLRRLQSDDISWSEIQSEYGRYLKEDLYPDALERREANARRNGGEPAASFTAVDLIEAMNVDLSNDVADLARRCIQVQRTRAALCRALDQSTNPTSLAPLMMNEPLIGSFLEGHQAALGASSPEVMNGAYNFLTDSSILLCREHRRHQIEAGAGGTVEYAHNDTGEVEQYLRPLEEYLLTVEEALDGPEGGVTPTMASLENSDPAQVSLAPTELVYGTAEERREFQNYARQRDETYRQNEQRLLANQRRLDPAGNRQLITGGIDPVVEGSSTGGGTSSANSGGPIGTSSEGLFGRDSADFARQQYPGVSGAAGSGGPNLPPDREALAAREELEEREMSPEERRLQERLEELERRERALMARLEELEQQRQQESSEELIAQYQAQIEQLNREVAANRTRLEEQRAELAERTRVARETRIQTPPETPAPFSGFGGGTRAARVSEPAAATVPSANTPVAGRNGGGSGVIRRSGGGSETPIAPSSVVTGSGAGGSTAPVLSLSSSAILPTGTNLVQLAQEAVGAVAYRRTAQTGMVERVVFETANGEIVYKDGQPEIAYIELVSEAQIALEGSTTPGRAPASLLDRNETPEELDERDPTRYRGLLRVMDESLGD